MMRRIEINGFNWNSGENSTADKVCVSSSQSVDQYSIWSCAAEGTLYVYVSDPCMFLCMVYMLDRNDEHFSFPLKHI